jgi:hypothetical protein
MAVKTSAEDKKGRERRKSEHFSVKMVFVGNDVA